MVVKLFSFIELNIVLTFSVRETHQLAEAQQEKNARLREAFGISSNFVEGSSLKGGSRVGPGGRAEAPYLPVRTPSPDLEPEPKKKKRHARLVLHYFLIFISTHEYCSHVDFGVL